MPEPGAYVIAALYVGGVGCVLMLAAGLLALTTAIRNHRRS